MKTLLILILLCTANAYAKNIKTETQINKSAQSKKRSPANFSDIGVQLHNIWQGNVETNSPWKDEDLNIERDFIDNIRVSLNRFVIKDSPDNLKKKFVCNIRVGGLLSDRPVDRTDFAVLDISRGYEMNADESWGSDNNNFNIRINRDENKVSFISGIGGGFRGEEYTFDANMVKVTHAESANCTSSRCVVVKCEIR